MAQTSNHILPHTDNIANDKAKSDYVADIVSNAPTCETNMSHNEYKQQIINTKTHSSNDPIDDNDIEWRRLKNTYLYGPIKETNNDYKKNIPNLSKTIFDQLRQQHWNYVDLDLKLDKICSENIVLKHQINVLNNNKDYMAHKSVDNFNLNKRYLNQIRNEQISLKQQINGMQHQTNNQNYKSIRLVVIFMTIIAMCCGAMYCYMNNNSAQMEQGFIKSMKLQYNNYENHINELQSEIALINDTNNILKTHQKIINGLQNKIKEQNENILMLKHIHDREMEVFILELEEYWFNDIYRLVGISIVIILVFFNEIKQRQCNKHNCLMIDDFLNRNGYIKAKKNPMNDTNNTKAKTVPTDQSQKSNSSANNANQNYNNEGDASHGNNNNNNNNSSNNNHSGNNGNSAGDGNGGRPPRKNIKPPVSKGKKKKRKKKQKKNKKDRQGSNSAPNPTITKLTPKKLNPDAQIFSPPSSPPLSNIKKGKFMYTYSCLPINEKEIENKPINEPKGEESAPESADSVSLFPKKKRKNGNKKKKKKCKRKNLTSSETRYDASETLRGRGKIRVEKEMFDIICNSIKEKYNNLNDFMDKAVAIFRGLEQPSFDTEHGTIKILNYDFHHKDTNEIMYCILKKDQKAMDGNFDWSVTALMNANDIKSVYDINAISLPLSFRDNPSFNMDKITTKIQKLKAIVTDSSKIFPIIDDAPWTNSDVVQVFFKKNGHQTTTLSVEKEAFMKQFKKSVGDSDSLQIIPILVFKGDSYWIEYVWIVSVGNSTKVGISFKYENDNDVKITGIHCDRDCLLQQHQLISCGSEGQKYEFWDNFTSNITYLNICGNPSPRLYRSQFQKSKDFIKKWVHTRLIDVESFRRDGKEFIKNINSIN